ncbi:DEAD/DEAH box helicase [Hoyosella rhizosphaerae]|uniref:Helicase SNF2 n=1 Tax=Hoyosella rhizosphaerae TaxID=1755582 RepID=A0A916U2N9_9ACTN|nr:DEAD/DEAH box helicase [Hoyosella rhizosphaerae]MBN4926568.1 DEAD/DEAH box helicase [Hoyosella rhizosphaerae]GGC58218.1 helicase SNF2 [Hoyosella rhizosphaerae]
MVSPQHTPRSEPTLPRELFVAAKSRIGAPAQQALKISSWILHHTEILMRAPETLREQVRMHAREVAESSISDILRTVSLADLRPYLDGSVRLGALENAGIKTVEDVRSRPPSSLTPIPGVGAHTAMQVSVAANKVAEDIARDVAVRLDPNRRTPAQTALLQTVAALRQADEATLSTGRQLQRLALSLRPAADAAAPAVSKTRMFFSGSRTKHRVLAGLLELERLITHPDVIALQHQLSDALSAVEPSPYDPVTVWAEFERDPAAFYSFLSTMGLGGTPDTEASHGFIGDELAQRVSDVHVDTSLLAATLRGYQLFGAQFILHRRRIILGDEMGLGKTVQALAAIAHLARAGQHRALVVCPTSVHVNWLKESEKHTKIDVHSLHGRDRDISSMQWRRDGGIAVTTFGTVGNLGLDHSEIDIMVVDEAHYVKNPDTIRSRVIRQLTMQAEYVAFLSGTPMENRVSEFKALVGYLQPDVGETLNPGVTIAGARSFRRKVAPVYLRRNQEDVLTELPERIEVEEWVEFSPEDDREYRTAVFSGNFMSMRRAAYVSSRSAKRERLRELVEEACDDGLKVLVFSYFLDVLNSVSHDLGSSVVGVISGSVSPPKRQELVDRFTAKKGGAVLLSQIEAGGVGLNIQAASIVILTEPQWKPSVEEQAIARAHRMGQIRTVQVHRILAKDTVDEHIRLVQEQKQALFDEYARKSDAKDADALAVFTEAASEKEPGAATERAVIAAERARIGVSLSRTNRFTTSKTSN